MSKIVFRGVVATSAILYLVWYLLPYDSFHSDPAAVNLLRLDGYAALFTPQHSLFTHGLLLLWLVASVGLWHFDNWARHLFLALTAWSVIAGALYGIRVSSPLEMVLGLILDLTDGAILAMAYLSSAKEFFKVKQTNNLPVQQRQPPTGSSN